MYDQIIQLNGITIQFQNSEKPVGFELFDFIGIFGFGEEPHLRISEEPEGQDWKKKALFVVEIGWGGRIRTSG